MAQTPRMWRPKPGLTGVLNFFPQPLANIKGHAPGIGIYLSQCNYYLQGNQLDNAS